MVPNIPTKSHHHAGDAWIRAMQNIMNFGSEIDPRGMITKELMPQIVQFNMNHPVCFHQDRNLSYIFMAAEAYWILSGDNMVEGIAPYNKHIAQFSDDGHIFNGNYGGPFNCQLDYAVNTLANDPSSRQSVITIWQPNPVRTKDYRCTVSLIFMIRDNEMHTHVTMRSSDAWLGLPYDMFNFTMLTLRVLNNFNNKTNSEVTLGVQTLSLMSSHLYEQHWTPARMVSQTPRNNKTYGVPNRALVDWQFVIDSLLACRDKTETIDHWRIRPL